jgi:hypothetical protein
VCGRRQAASDPSARVRAEAIAVNVAAGIDGVRNDVGAERRKRADVKLSMIGAERRSVMEG